MGVSRCSSCLCWTPLQSCKARGFRYVECARCWTPLMTTGGLELERSETVISRSAFRCSRCIDKRECRLTFVESESNEEVVASLAGTLNLSAVK